LKAIAQLADHGMIFVTVECTARECMFCRIHPSRQIHSHYCKEVEETKLIIIIILLLLMMMMMMMMIPKILNLQKSQKDITSKKEKTLRTSKKAKCS
jgi:hypothetical protein